MRARLSYPSTPATPGMHSGALLSLGGWGLGHGGYRESGSVYEGSQSRGGETRGLVREER